MINTKLQKLSKQISLLQQSIDKLKEECAHHQNITGHSNVPMLLEQPKNDNHSSLLVCKKEIEGQIIGLKIQHAEFLGQIETAIKSNMYKTFSWRLFGVLSKVLSNTRKDIFHLLFSDEGSSNITEINKFLKLKRVCNKMRLSKVENYFNKWKKLTIKLHSSLLSFSLNNGLENDKILTKMHKFGCNFKSSERGYTTSQFNQNRKINDCFTGHYRTDYKHNKENLSENSIFRFKNIVLNNLISLCHKNIDKHIKIYFYKWKVNCPEIRESENTYLGKLLDEASKSLQVYPVFSNMRLCLKEEKYYNIKLKHKVFYVLKSNWMKNRRQDKLRKALTFNDHHADLQSASNKDRFINKSLLISKSIIQSRDLYLKRKVFSTLNINKIKSKIQSIECRISIECSEESIDKLNSEIQDNLSFNALANTQYTNGQLYSKTILKNCVRLLIKFSNAKQKHYFTEWKFLLQQKSLKAKGKLFLKLLQKYKL